MWRVTPHDEAALLQQASRLAGMTLAQLAMTLRLSIPQHTTQRKGWAGRAIEMALGAPSGNLARPDFDVLGIELKTIPMLAPGKPTQSTFITSIPLLTIHEQTWKTSTCYAKLKRVLWIPIEDCETIPFMHRRIGQGVLWSPSAAQETILENDWRLLTGMIATGRLAELDARLGEYLQVRPKGANAKSLCEALNDAGQKVMTLPRGFYLRRLFTAQVLQVAQAPEAAFAKS